MRTVIQLGADEGFELAKATLCLKGHQLYTEIWNDQPPLHTFLVTQLIKHCAACVLAPRLLTVGFSALFLISLFLLGLRSCGPGVATLNVGLLICAPGFLELSGSCMLEIPALALATSALCVLTFGGRTRWPAWEAVSGVLFAAAFQIKLVPVFMMPLALFILWQQCGGQVKPIRKLLISASVLGLSLLRVIPVSV